MKTRITLRLALLTSLFVICHSSFVIAQGPLTPPGAPAPTMKTLDQVEARTPIGSAPFTITTSGSYYLTGNVAVTTGNGIAISADDVTLDLNGFTVSSTASPASGTGVRLNGNRRNVTVRNGHIRGTTTFAAGTFTTGGFLFGINHNSLTGANIRISEINVSGVADGGIDLLVSSASPRCVIERCSVSVCGGLGLRAGRMRDCDAETTGSAAIVADTATNCFGESEGADVNDYGIRALSVVENCRGLAIAGSGVEGGQVNNSSGTSISGTGLAAGSAYNCRGASTSGTGLTATTAHTCVAFSTSGAFALSAVGGTASFCFGQRSGGVAINAINAIGCTVSSGTVTATNKSLGTP